jgi:hypothetical protein
MGEHFPASVAGLARIDRDHDRLRAEAVRRLGHELRPLDRGGVDAHLVRPGVEELPHVFHRAHPAAHGEGDEDLVGHALDHLHDRVALVAGRRDVEEGELVGAGGIVAARDLDRVAGVAQLDEIHALHHAAGVHVEAGNEALGERHGTRRGGAVQASPAATLSACAKSSLPS